MSCSCGGSDSPSLIQQLDLSSLANLQTLAARDAADGQNTQRLWMIGSQPTIASGTADGKKGCVTIPHLGVPVKLCWEIKEIDPIPPEVSIKIRVAISVAGIEYYSAILVLKCDNIANPSTCTVSVEGDNALDAALRPRCNWGCLRQCAPGCISCGTDYWCWAACAGSCILRCCSIF